MKSLKSRAAVTAIAAATLSIAASPACADDEMVMATQIRVSELVGTDIVNDADQDVGEIKDVVLDPKTGRVEYVVVTYGGFLGMGNKLFAVPFEAFKFMAEADDRDDYEAVLNVTKEQLEGDAGFDDDNWPNLADPKFAADVRRRYGVGDRRMNER